MQYVVNLCEESTYLHVSEALEKVNFEEELSRYETWDHTNHIKYEIPEYVPKSYPFHTSHDFLIMICCEKAKDYVHEHDYVESEFNPLD